MFKALSMLAVILSGSWALADYLPGNIMAAKAAAIHTTLQKYGSALRYAQVGIEPQDLAAGQDPAVVNQHADIWVHVTGTTALSSDANPSAFSFLMKVDANVYNTWCKDFYEIRTSAARGGYGATSVTFLQQQCDDGSRH